MLHWLNLTDTYLSSRWFNLIKYSAIYMKYSSILKIISKQNGGLKKMTGIFCLWKMKDIYARWKKRNLNSLDFRIFSFTF